jgi:hypothetical protein
MISTLMTTQTPTLGRDAQGCQATSTSSPRAIPGPDQPRHYPRSIAMPGCWGLSRPLRPEAKLPCRLPGLWYAWPGKHRPLTSAGVRGCRWRLLLSWLLGRSRAGVVSDCLGGRLGRRADLLHRPIGAAWPLPSIRPGVAGSASISPTSSLADSERRRHG